MGKEHVSHGEIARFAKDKVNLPKDKADTYRDQAKRLQDRLTSYLEENPDFELRRMITSESLAKGTALKSLNDIDVGCYISGVDTTVSVSNLLDYLVEKLRKAFPNFKADQIKPQTYSVTVSFMGSGLDVDIVPIIYDGNKEWYGHLVNQQDGTFLMTNIPLHLDFIRKRKSSNKVHFSQLARLIKFWARRMKVERNGFKFKSFMIELILSKLTDEGLDCSDYIEGMQSFFTYIGKSNIRELISFTDYYSTSELENYPEPVKIIDPVNAANDAAKLYTDTQADLIVDAALDAGDAIDSASFAPTKEKTIYYWQKVFGPSFSI